MTANESPIYHNISKQYGYTLGGDSGDAAPAEGWKTWFIRKIRVELRWIGKLPGNLHRVRIPGTTGPFHRIKVDEVAGYVINTFTEGGLVVSDIHDHRVLWSLDEKYCAPFVHCEHDQGYIVFNRYDNYKEVWRRRTDVLDIPENAWPSGLHNKPDGLMIRGNRVAERVYLDPNRSRDPDHLRGQFVPWARLLVPEDGRAFKLTRGTLLVCSAQKAFLFDVGKGELQQTIEVVATTGRLRYVDISEQHVFIVCSLQLSVYDRATGSGVLAIPAGRQPWDFYANPENQWRRTEETLNHGELGFRRAEPSNRSHRDDYFHAAHVSSCGKNLAIKATSNRVILIQDFWRLLPTLSSSSPPASVPSSVMLRDISKQVDFYGQQPTSEPEGYLAYDSGKVAIIGTQGIYVLVLDSILDQFGDIKPLPKDISLQTTQPASLRHEQSWPNLRLRQVGFENQELFSRVMFLCLQLTETKLYFSLLPTQEEDLDDNMWYCDFSSSPRPTPTGLPEGGDLDEEGDSDSEGQWETEPEWDEDDGWDELEARLAGDRRRSGRGG